MVGLAESVDECSGLISVGMSISLCFSEAGSRSARRPAVCCLDRSRKRCQLCNFLPAFKLMFDMVNVVQPREVECVEDALSTVDDWKKQMPLM